MSVPPAGRSTPSRAQSTTIPSVLSVRASSMRSPWVLKKSRAEEWWDLKNSETASRVVSTAAPGDRASAVRQGDSSRSRRSSSGSRREQRGREKQQRQDGKVSSRDVVPPLDQSAQKPSRMGPVSQVPLEAMLGEEAQALKPSGAVLKSTVPSPPTPMAPVAAPSSTSSSASSRHAASSSKETSPWSQ